MKLTDELYTKGDTHTGETIYFSDEKLTVPFTGTAFEEFDGYVNISFDVKNGFKDGVEKIFHDESDVLQQITEYKTNLQYGVSKEYDEDGTLLFVSVIWNNKYLKTLTISEGGITERDEDFDLNQNNYPDRIKELLNLTDKALIDYSF